MGIAARTGLDGSGKSYSAVSEDIIPALKKGRRVYTNLPLKVDMLNAIHGVDPDLVTILDDQGLVQLYVDRYKEGNTDTPKILNSLIVHDELQKVFPSGEWDKSESRLAFRTFLAWQRHDGCDFIWLSQNHSSVDAECRKRTAVYMHYLDFSRFGVPRFRVRTWVPDLMGEPTEPVGDKYFTLDKRVYLCYQSFSGTQGGTHGVFRQGLPFKIVALGVIVAALFASAGYMVVRNKGIPLTTEEPTKSVIEQTKGPKNEIATSGQKSSSNSSVSADSWICINDVCDLYSGGEWFGKAAWNTIDSGSTFDKVKITISSDGADPLDSRNASSVSSSGGQTLPGTARPTP